jgi:hypothetical protein
MRLTIRLLIYTLGLLSALSGAILAGDTPGFKVDWYGQIKLDASWDQNPTSHGNYAMWVNPPLFKADDAQMNITHRATRLGLKAKGEGFQNLALAGNVEVDFYGTGTENKAGLMVRHAYLTLQKGRFKFLAGQTWDLIAPLNPATLNYAVLWGAGNIQYRRPQFSVFYLLGDTVRTKIELAAGAFRNQGYNLMPNVELADGEKADSDDDGTDAALPALQSRIDITHQCASGWSIRGGVSSLWSRLQAQTNQGQTQKYESWAACAHVMVSIPGGAGVSGELFRGSNLGSYYGGILDTSRVDGLATVGGWGSAWCKLLPKLVLTTGFALDNPKDADLSKGDRSFNQVLFGNLKYTVAQPLTLGVEISRWQTSYVLAEAADAVRVEASAILAF